MALFRCSSGSGGSFAPTNLWTNDSPTSTFASNQVTLSQSVDNFTYIGIKFRSSTTDDASIEVLTTVADLKKSVSGSSGARICIGANNSSYRYDRGIAYDDATHITFGQAVRSNGSGTVNTLAIPTEINGYN